MILNCFQLEALDAIDMSSMNDFSLVITWVF
jgi:hypothetical protein